MKVATVKSVSTGHSPYPSRGTNEGSANVFVSGYRVHRIGDTWVTHCSPEGDCHNGCTSSGSGSVFCNGKGVARVGDAIDCGDFIATGVDSVLVGD